MPLPHCKTLPLYTVITLSNFTISSNVDNRTLVCGSLDAKNAAFALQLNHEDFPPDEYTLEVNGLVTSKSSKVLAGSMAVSSNESLPSNSVSDSASYEILIDHGDRGAQVKIDPSLSDKCKNTTAELRELSEFLAKRPPTPENKATPSSNEPGRTFVLHVKKVNCNGVAIFNVTVDATSSMFDLSDIVITTELDNIQLILINILGPTIHLKNSMNIASSNWFKATRNGRARTLFHCPNAHYIKLESNWYGAIVAPGALVENGHFRVYGTMAVRSLKAKSSIHNPTIKLPVCI